MLERVFPPREMVGRETSLPKRVREFVGRETSLLKRVSERVGRETSSSRASSNHVVKLEPRGESRTSRDCTL